VNGVHDMGGSEGHGPIKAEPEKDEPVFHAEWEGRVYGINRSLGNFGLWNIDIGRQARERIKPADYLRNSYYENWLAGIQTLMLEAGLVTEEELRTGKASSPLPPELLAKKLLAKDADHPSKFRTSYMREAAEPARFRVGDRVRTLNRHPPGHTREPRYLRGKVGTIHDYYGVQVFPDLKVQGVDVGHHLYSVRFEAVELWGESATPRGAVYADLWEPYLEALK
jgi:nitrile hydratase